MQDEIQKQHMGLAAKLIKKLLDLTVKDLETQINNTLKNDYKNNLIMKTYCFYLL